MPIFGPGYFPSGFFPPGYHPEGEVSGMPVQTFLSELYLDELSDMFAGNRNNQAEGRSKLLTLMNAGMTVAYARWKCRYGSELLSLVEGTKEYVLTGTQVLAIVQVMNSYGLEVPSTKYQVLGQRLYFPCPETQEVEVVYKTTHTPYTTAQNDEEVYVELPTMLIPWLKAYVCHRFFASMKTEEALLQAANFLNQMSTCEVVFVNTNTTGEFTAPTNCKLWARGFA